MGTKRRILSARRRLALQLFFRADKTRLLRKRSATIGVRRVRPMATFQIEFVRHMEGHADPAVVARLNADIAHRYLHDVISHAQHLHRPAEANGLQIRERDGPTLYRMVF